MLFLLPIYVATLPISKMDQRIIIGKGIIGPKHKGGIDKGIFKVNET